MLLMPVMMLSRVLAVAALLLGSVAEPLPRELGVCTLRASGGDDAPAFLAAARSHLCSTVSIPKHETLNIASRLNMTGIRDKHIVRGGISFGPR